VIVFVFLPVKEKKKITLVQNLIMQLLSKRILSEPEFMGLLGLAVFCVYAVVGRLTNNCSMGSYGISFVQKACTACCR